jgi:hypothetical protein
MPGIAEKLEFMKVPSVKVCVKVGIGKKPVPTKLFRFLAVLAITKNSNFHLTRINTAA